MFDQVVVALGPWSPDTLAPLGMKVPMAFERGYHMHYGWGGECGVDPAGVRHGSGLCAVAHGRRPAPHDGRGADRPRCTRQPRSADDGRKRGALGVAAGRTPAGYALARLQTHLARQPPHDRAGHTGHAGLWLAFGHQHIGFSTGPGTAALLGAMVDGEAPPIDRKALQPGPFRPLSLWAVLRTACFTSWMAGSSRSAGTTTTWPARTSSSGSRAASPWTAR